MEIRRVCLAAFVGAALSGISRADDWPQFRGPSGTGASAEKEAPVEWGPGKNVRWTTAIPGTGSSSPIISRGRVFVTAAEGKGRKRSLVCLDRKTGQVLWTQSVESPEEPTQEENPYCGSSPCADGERVVVWHSSAGLHCYDFEGRPLWTCDLGRFDHMWGYGSSPIFHGDRVVLNCGPGNRTFLVSVEKKTGRVVWKAEEPGGDSKKWIGSWATPVPVQVDGAPQLVVGMPGAVRAYDPETGKVLWSCPGLSHLVYADVVVGNGMGVATGEDEGGDSIGFKLGGQKLWARPRGLEVGTGALIEGRLWTVDNGGFVRCTELATGQELLKARSPGGPAWGSMVTVGGRIYVTCRSGDTIVFAPDPQKFTPLAVNRLGEPSNSTPAVSDGELFLRSMKSVTCVGR